MPTQNETRGALEFLLAEANGYRSRNTVTIESGQTLKAGHVLGKTTGGEYKEYSPTDGDGADTAVALLAHDVDASGGAKEATIIDNQAEAHAGLLVYFSGATDAEKATANGELYSQSGIRVRS